MKEKMVNLFFGLIPLTIFLLVWQFIISTNDRTLFLFSSPHLILQSLVNNTKTGILPNDFWVTGQEAFYGFLIGNSVGGIIGLSLWYSRRIARVIKPYIIAIGAIPIFSIAPMMIIWFGTGLYAKVMLVIFSTIIIAITQSYEGASQVDPQQIKLFKSFGASRTQIFIKLIVPSSLVWLFNSLKLNVGFAILGSFIGEFISAPGEGLGFRILKAGATYDVALVLASVIYLLILAFLFSLAITLVEKSFMKWK